MILLLATLAGAQDLGFPTSADDYGAWYPTAYYDHGGTDWNCGSIRYSGHRGSDFGGGSFTGMDEGRDVTAAAHGVVVAVNDGEFDRCTSGECAGGGGFGNYVKLQHASGTATYYAHLKQWSVGVAVGDSVSCGDKLGEMGSSGYSTGPHLHLDARDLGNNRLDPFAGDCGDAVNWWVDPGAYDELPARTCDEDYPACEPLQELTCGDAITTRNDATGSTNTHHVYGCHTAIYTGPEVAYTVKSGADEPVTVRIDGLEADLDLYALEDAECMGRACLAVSHEVQDTADEITVDALADVPFTVVVDGWQGAVSPFTLTVDCDTPFVPEDTDPPLDTDPVDTAPPVDNDEGGSQGRREPGGCGCAHGSSAGWLALLTPLWWRRRR